MAPAGWLFRLLLLLLPAAIGDPLPQTAVHTQPPLIIKSMAGGDLFRFYCAACHGADGRGHGAVAVTLRKAPSDLTTLSRRHGGSFPREDVARYLTGEEPVPVVAHGTTDMPVWGPIFRALDPDEKTRQVRIGNTIDYIESLQVK